MLFADVNLLVYAHRPEVPSHQAYRTYLTAAIHGDEPIGFSDHVLAGFLRVVTHPRIFREPTPLPLALDFTAAVRAGAASLRVAPGERTWPVFVEIAMAAEVRGNSVPDALIAAMAIEQGATLITADRGFARFPRLRWRHPLD